MNSNLPPSGPWSGYYLYGLAGPKHRMKLGLSFALDGKISGEGIDDVGRFAIDGFFDAVSNEARWTKQYIGQHSVDYRGLYDQRTICGNWTLGVGAGGFWIWPDAIGEQDSLQLELELEHPRELVLK